MITNTFIHILWQLQLFYLHLNPHCCSQQTCVDWCSLWQLGRQLDIRTQKCGAQAARANYRQLALNILVLMTLFHKIWIIHTAVTGQKANWKTINSTLHLFIKNFRRLAALALVPGGRGDLDSAKTESSASLKAICNQHLITLDDPGPGRAPTECGEV